MKQRKPGMHGWMRNKRSREEELKSKSARPPSKQLSRYFGQAQGKAWNTEQFTDKGRN